jgi:putative DNA methylase
VVRAALGARASRLARKITVTWERGRLARKITVHKGWYSRGYLPHFDHPSLLQFITFRLADSLPQEVIQKLTQTVKDAASRRRSIEAYLDAGHGACPLREPDNAHSVEEALLHFDGERYRLLAWVVMPNHVHVLVETLPSHSLSTIVHSWKSYTARAIGKRLGHRGQLWQPDYFDRYIRDEKHFQAVVRYIHNNPVKAGLVDSAEAWKFSSAHGVLGAWLP